jgi:hypothetical protein
MLYSVFQYFPILEEETPSHRVELAKKLKQNDGTDESGSDEDETDTDSKEDINYYPVSSFIYVLNYKHNFPPKTDAWPCQFETINTPPPQI